MRELSLIALDIGRVLDSRIANAARVNLRALLRMRSLADSFDGKPARAWIVRTVNSLSRHHARNDEIKRYIEELYEIIN